MFDADINEKSDYHFGIKVDKQFQGAWSFGSCISHSFGETYLFINFFKWTISIGYLFKDMRGEDNETN